MEYTFFEGMTLPFLLDERSNTMHANSVSSSASTHLLESFHAPQQQRNQSYNFYNPQLYNFPAVSWSTTDPTLLLTDQQQQQHQPEFLSTSGGNVKVSCDSTRDESMEIQGSCGPASSFPTVQQLFHNRSSSDLRHHAVLDNSIGAMIAEQMDLHGDMNARSDRSNRRDNALSSSSSATNIDPFSFFGGGGGDGGSGVNASSSRSQWLQQMCSLSSDQYYSCGDDLMMPKLVSDPFKDSPQQQQQPCSYYTLSMSVNCLHEADSSGSSDRDRSTTSEEINWMNNSSCNNSDQSNLPNLLGCGGDSVPGLILSSSVPVELSDELSSSIAAAADDVELATITTLDHVQPHHHLSACGSTATSVERGAAAAPSGRVSWMSANIGGVQKNRPGNGHVTTTTLDPLLLLGSAAATTSPAQQQQQFSNGLLSAPRSELGLFKPQHQAHTLDGLLTRMPPFSFSTSQNCSSSISPRYSSVYSMPRVINPGLVDNCTTSRSSFYEDFDSFSSRPQQQGLVATPSSQGPAAGGARFKEFNVGGGVESRKDYCSDQITLLSACRKPNATSIEPQSVAARYRRKKISERVRILETLIPGGNRMDTATMLDEAIEYVKFLQLQVQLLESMGEPETLNVHGGIVTAKGGRSASSFTTAARTQTTTATTNCSAFHPDRNNCNVDSSALTVGGFGSSHDLSRSSALVQQVTTAAAAAAAATATPKSIASPPLILSEVLQEQLFKQKLCLVSLRQYKPQGLPSAVGSIDWHETNQDRAM